MERPPTSYARSGDVSIAYQVFGEGDLDLLHVPGFVNQVEMVWDYEPSRRWLERLAAFSRVITFDRRGTGLSDPVSGTPTLDDRMDDLRAVMDAAGSERAALMGISEGVPLCLLFAATYPERVRALVSYGGSARSTYAEDYPWALPAEALAESAIELILPGWGDGSVIEVVGRGRVGEKVTVCIRPENVTLAIPDGTAKTSARNTFRGRIGRIIPLGLVHRVEIACGFPLVAFVTTHALEDLSLKEGDEVAASVKATAIHVIRKGGG